MLRAKARLRVRTESCPEPIPGGLPSTLEAAQRMHAWTELKARLQQLHAELEYLRLMLVLRPPNR